MCPFSMAAPQRDRPKRRSILRRLLCLIICLALAGLTLLLRLGSSLAPPSRGSAAQPLATHASAVDSSLPTRQAIFHDTADESACEDVSKIGNADCLPRRLIFVGGLQRSGTSTLAALLDALPGAAGLHFDAHNATHMETAPWKRLVDVHTGRWMKWAYFKEVISTGGAEGKLLQSVFPYRYSVWDARYTRVPALLAQPSALSPLISSSSRDLLWAQWRRFWTPGPAFIDKSPENASNRSPHSNPCNWRHAPLRMLALALRPSSLVCSNICALRLNTFARD